MNEHVLEIEDMSCSQCIAAVSKALASISGMKVLGVALGRARVEGDPGMIAEAIAALDRIGFPARAHAAYAPGTPQPRTPEA